MQSLFLTAVMVPALPILAFVVIIAFTRKNKTLSSLVSIAAIAGSLGISAYLYYAVAHLPGPVEYSVPWLYLGPLHIDMGVLLNPLTVIMLLVVSLVSLLVQIYSIGYMKEDEGYSKFFAFLSLFSFSMLGIVIANNFVQLYVFWELVGLSSYLLIGFWYHKPEAAEAAKKAFVVTRFGDFGFLIGIILISTVTGTFNFQQAMQAVQAQTIQPWLLTLIALLLFSGAVGKSGQFPLHVWLPDAMEGPTPVSALIHAATMVAAGVFMVARLFGIFSASPEAMLVIAWIGGFTAIFAASIAVAQDDIKKILAYSTVSQLGYMMLALGVGGYTQGMFHLVTHASFKALLFLCAGSVIHGMHTNNIWEMGGLRKKMPVTAATFLIGALALSGIFPFAGFWSKDEILSVTLASGNNVLYYGALVTAFLTAFYMFKMFFVVFTGKENPHSHAHESPKVMTVPLIVLAVLSVFIGFIGFPGIEGNLFGFLRYGEAHEAPFNMAVAITSTIVALTGILLAFLIYKLKVVKADTLREKSGIFHQILKNKYYVDEFYLLLVNTFVYGISRLISWTDRHVVDKAVNLVAGATRGAGNLVKLTLNGKVQSYAMIVIGGILLVLIAFAIYQPEALKLIGGRP